MVRKFSLRLVRRLNDDSWTYSIDESGAVHDQFRDKPMSIACHKTEASAEHQVAHDIVGQIRGPLRHVERFGPSLVMIVAHDIAERLSILQEERLRGSQRLVGECMFHHSPIRSVDFAVNLGVNTVCASC
jgi:hypothetical protein